MFKDFKDFENYEDAYTLYARITSGNEPGCKNASIVMSPERKYRVIWVTYT